MAVAGTHNRGICLYIAKRLDRQSEQIGGDLRVGGLMAHAVRLRTNQQCHATIVIEAKLRAFVRRPARGLHEAGHADAAQHAAHVAMPRAER